MHFFQIHIKMTVKAKMAIMVVAVIDFAVLSCSSLINGSGGNMKVCCSGVVNGWVAASVL